ncbi:helix-turn-helix domain-containing protein [Bacillus sp. EB600]|uniref:helix-turn-helix domain-containing protein n=1 Tax=Bacillus sp. EB600 TaxID=2806345 RepID=UPI002109999D|nr:helix-turn-helix domain-containing protein [Bacillus sp. EB600]MCQ6282367.1 helix-turn-helix domain-containing protein [Bacillus sp. EB600]
MIMMETINLGLTTKEVAETLGVTEQTIYNYVKEGRVTPWNKETWKMDGTYLFRAEEVERVESELKKPGFTTKDIIAYLEGFNIKVSPSTVISKMKSGELPAVMKPYRNIDTFFVKKEDLDANLHLFNRVKGREKFFDKKTGYFLFQPFENKVTGEFARIMEWDGAGNGKVLTNREREILIEDIKQQEFQPVIELGEGVVNNKKGSLVFKFAKPKQVKSLIFDLIDQFYRIAGPNNMKLEVSDGEIKIEMKPILLPFDKAEHRDEIDLLNNSLVEGKMICRPNGVVLDSDLVSFVAYGSTQLKDQVKEYADIEGVTQEEFIIQSLKDAVQRRIERK